MILLVNIGLIFAIETKNVSYRRNELDTKEILDKHLDKDIIYLQDNVYPTYYKVQLTIKSDSNIYLWGQVDINITIALNNIQTLLLHAKNIVLNNSATKLKGAKKTYFVNKSDIIQDDILEIKFKELVPPDVYTLTIVFDAITNALFRDELPYQNAEIKEKE